MIAAASSGGRQAARTFFERITKDIEIVRVALLLTGCIQVLAPTTGGRLLGSVRAGVGMEVELRCDLPPGGMLQCTAPYRLRSARADHRHHRATHTSAHACRESATRSTTTFSLSGATTGSGRATKMRPTTSSWPETPAWTTTS